MTPALNQAAFIVLEAELAFYISTAGDEPVGEAYLGGVADRLIIEDEFKERQVQTHGVAYGGQYHEDEQHLIELENVWMWDWNSTDPRMPQITRNQRLIMVAVWYDNDTRAWAKRTFYGVTAFHQRIPGDAKQILRFHAERFTPAQGYGDKPDLLPADYGIVRYRDGSTTSDVYFYDPQSHLYTPTGGVPYAVFTRNATTFSIAINEVLALRAVNGTGLHVVTLTAAGATYGSGRPRIEFYSGGTRMASLTEEGELIVPDVTEQDTAPAGTGFDFYDTGGHWLASLRAGRAYAPAFIEEDL